MAVLVHSESGYLHAMFGAGCFEPQERPSPTTAGLARRPAFAYPAAPAGCHRRDVVVSQPPDGAVYALCGGLGTMYALFGVLSHYPGVPILLVLAVLWPFSAGLFLLADVRALHRRDVPTCTALALYTCAEFGLCLLGLLLCVTSSSSWGVWTSLGFSTAMLQFYLRSAGQRLCVPMPSHDFILLYGLLASACGFCAIKGHTLAALVVLVGAKSTTMHVLHWGLAEAVGSC